MSTRLGNRVLLALALAALAPLSIGNAIAAQSGQPPGNSEQAQAEKKAKDAKEEEQKNKGNKGGQGRAQADRPQQAAAQQQQANVQEQQANAQQQQAKARQQQADARDLQAKRQDDQAQARQQQADARDSQANARQQQAKAQQQQAKAQQQQADARDAQAKRQEAQSKPREQQARPGQPPLQSAQQDRSPQRDKAGAGKRLSEQQQQQMISEQKVRVGQYRQYTDRQLQLSRTVATQLQQQKRTQQYQYVSDYNRRLQLQQRRYSSQNFDYYNDPYFYSAPIYRYQRDGRYYTLNQYGANLLNQAINEGYSEGFRAGRADRLDHWRADYRNSFAYQDASYGYNGYYLDRDDYSYYFRQGFQRGYEDGYYNRYRYGRQQNGNYSILGALIATILNLQSY